MRSKDKNAVLAPDVESTIAPNSTVDRKYHIWTIGCQMNVADSNHVASELEKIGYSPTEDLDDAEVVVLNTCVVRQSAENKVVGKLGSLKPWRLANPKRTLALMGCMVGVNPSLQLVDAYPQVDVFMPPSEATPLVNYLRQEDINAEMAAIEREQLLRRYRMQDQALPGGRSQSIKHLVRGDEGPIAAYVPVVYGCSHACTFCIIPFRRGVERSRPTSEIVEEIRGLVAQGVREVTLLGQIVDRYGYDWRGELGNSAAVGPYTSSLLVSKAAQEESHAVDLANLMYAIHEIDGLWRIRFLTSHPNYMTDRILESVRDLPKVCEHIEVPIQSGDDEILAQMKRGYSNTDYRDLVRQIRSIIPDVAINSDIIVGFCGESDAQFQQTYDVLYDLRLDKVHLARYSPRPGTVSARRLEDDVSDAEKIRRHKDLETLQENICASINQNSLGKTVEVLIEDQHKQKWRGRTRQNKLVFVDSDLPLRGRLIEAQISWTGPWSMQGRFVRDVSPLPDRILPKATFSVELRQ